ncbi:phage head closure protein [Roseobacter sinensis]|uniref:Phage head closure protein n=1 Tax=Roseobacter sinensis TaxID=2931391 RepID=A0ABT3BC25_9RHOB|nr:phage head closure protein [Roseobacter sp. WL0113]MCV3271136.1 phage head closure protein [Roseobacter sp. WL0113]
MSAPRLNRQLVLEAPQRLDDGAGGYVETWQALGTLWAEVKPRSGRERALSETAVSAMSYRITVRGAPFGDAQRPVPDQRFREGARLFLIEAVAEGDASGRYLTCFATEEVAV